MTINIPSWKRILNALLLMIFLISRKVDLKGVDSFSDFDFSNSLNKELDRSEINYILN